MARAKCVIQWDSSDVDRDGDEYQTYFVALGDDDGEILPNATIYKCSTRERAVNLAEKMGRDRHLEVILD